MRRLSLCASLLAVAVCARSATAGLDLTWNACNTSASGADNVVLSCDGSSGAQLFANFQSPQTISSFLAMDVVLDVRTSAGMLPPFWHFETGGCNESGLGLNDAKPTAQCPNGANGNLWGPNGNEATAAITAYDPGHGGTDRLRILITIARSSTSPIALTSGQNYFGFELDVAPDNAASCGGCTTPAVIGWSQAVLYGSTETVELYQSGTRLATVAVNGGIPGPTVFTVRPESGESSAPAGADLFGRNLVSGTTAMLTRSGQADITGTGTTTSTLGDLLHTTFDITGKPDGFWNVNVADGGNADALVNGFRTTGAFQVDSIFPRIGYLNTTTPVTIYGSQLKETASVRITLPFHPDVMGTGTSVAVDGHSLQTTFALQIADLGLWTVEVTNGDGSKKNVPGGFQVVAPLQISSVFPNVASNQGPAVLAVGGMGFRAGASVALTRAGQPDVVGAVLAIDPLGTLLQASFDLSGVPVGLWDLRVTNVGALPVTAGNVLLIDVPVTITSIEPHLGSNTESVAVVITGTRFQAGAAPRLTRAGQAAIVGTSVQVAPDGTSLSTIFNLTNRAAGIWDVEVENPNSLTGSLPAAFEIREGLRVTAVTPALAADTSVVSLVITGTAMVAGATARLTRGGQPDIVGTSVTVAAGGTSLTADFDIRGRAAGLWNVVVTNPDAVSAVLPNGFTLAKVPFVTSIAPTVGSNEGVTFATISGSGFMTEVSVRLERPSSPSIPGFVTGVNPEGTTIAVTLNLLGTTPGVYDVVVTNPGNLVGRLPAGFEVQVPPHIVSVAPPAARDTSTVTLVISGDRMVAGATASLGRFGQVAIPGTSISVDPSGTSLTGNFDVRGRALGLWDVRVTNPNGLADTLYNSFLITSGAFITSITPTTGSDQSWVDAVISGGSLTKKMAFRLDRLSTSILGLVTDVAPNGSWINVTFDLSETPAGFYDLVASSGGTSLGRLLLAFEVTSVPHIIRFSPGFAYDTSIVFCIIVGRRFDTGASVRLVSTSAPTVLGQGTHVTSHGDTMFTAFDLRGESPGGRSLEIVQQDASVLTTGAQFWIHSHTLLDAPILGPSDVLALSSVAPNPTSGRTTVNFSLSTETQVRLSVVDVAGRELAVLTNATLPAGRHEARWDGRGRQGPAPTGMYFMRMEAAGRTFTKRFVLSR